MKVMFLPNGNTACFDDKGQVPVLQKSYLSLYCEFLETQGVNPAEVKFLMPNDSWAKAYKTVSGDWNWSFN